MILLLLVLLSGCIGDDLDNCPTIDNCALKFTHTLPGAQDTVAFATVIRTVDILIFDMNHSLVERRKVEQQQLEAFAGITLTLAPGDYRVACIGNMQGKSELSYPGEHPFLDQTYLGTVGTDTGDPLYYAPQLPLARSGAAFPTRAADFSAFIVTIPERGVTEKEIPFMRIHRTFHVFVKGLDGNHLLQPPAVEIEHLPMKYSLDMELHPGRQTYAMPTSLVNEADGMLYACIKSPYDAITDEVRLTLRAASDGQAMTVFSLREFIEQNPSADTDDINVLIEFKNGSATITLPGWGEVPVEIK